MVYKRKKHLERSGTRRRGFLRILFWLALTIFFGSLIYLLFFSGYLRVTDIRIVDEKYIVEEKLLEKVQAELSGKLLWTVDRNNLLLVRKKRIEEDVLRSFRQVRSVEVRKEFPHELSVFVLERIPTLLFQGKNGIFILDENADAYDFADPNDPEIKKYDLPLLTDKDGKDINLGERVLDSKYLDYLSKIRGKMKDRADLETENEFTTPSLISDDIRLRTNEGWQVFFNQNIELEKEIEMLLAVLKSEIPESQRADLEYIDLRINNKVYYKFRDGTPEEDARLAEEQAAADTATQPTQAESSPSEKKDKKK